MRMTSSERKNFASQSDFNCRLDNFLWVIEEAVGFNPVGNSKNSKPSNKSLKVFPVETGKKAEENNVSSGDTTATGESVKDDTGAPDTELPKSKTTKQEGEDPRAFEDWASDDDPNAASVQTTTKEKVANVSQA